MDQDQVPASSASTSCNASTLTQRCRRTENQEDLGDIAAEVATIYNVDRQDSLQAQRTRRQCRTVAVTSEFISLEDLLRSQPEPAPGQEIVDMILRDFCSSPTYEEEEDLSTCESPPWFRFRKKKIKTYAKKRALVEQEVPSIALAGDDEEEDDRLSCSSGLSVQEDHTAPTATAVRELDANTSQKICENLLNLSQYFSLSNPSSHSNPDKELPPAVSTKIDLPAKEIPDPAKPSGSREQRSLLSDTNSSAECTSIELENLENDLLEIGFTFEASEVGDIKPTVSGNLGDTLFGDSKASTTLVQAQSDSKVCAEWSEGDSLLENYNTEKMSLSDEELKEKSLQINPVKTEPIEVKSESFTQSLLDGIPISEWQTPMDIPEDSIKETEDLNQETIKMEPNELISQKKTQETVEPSTSKHVSDADFLQEIPPDEWQPMEISEFVGFRTASDKPIEISKEMQEKAAKLLADVEGMAAEQPKYEQELSERPTVSSPSFVGFRTASNKPIEITEEMASKGAMFIAQFKASDQQSQPNDAEFLQDIAFSEWEAIDGTEKPIKKEELSQTINITHTEPSETQTPNKSQSRNIPQLVAFRKTPYKFMEVAEKMKIKGDKLMAEVESGLYQPSQRRYLQSQEELPVRNINSSNKVSEEMKKEAVEVNEVLPMETIVNPEFVGFKTASNKAIVVSEEMKIRAAQFMAEFQIASLSQEMERIGHEGSSNTEFIGLRTASNKTIEVSKEIKHKAANLMAEFQAESPQNINLKPEEVPEFFGFRTASNKRIEISEEMKNKAAKLMAEVHAEPEVVNPVINPTRDNECPSDTSDNLSGENFKGFPESGIHPLSADEDHSNDSVYPRRSQTLKTLPNCEDDSTASTPKNRRDTSDGIPSSGRLRKIANPMPEQNPQQVSRQLHKTTSCHSALGTPSQSQEIHASLSQLAGRSPLDQRTKTSVIARRNLLTLSKRRKRSRTPTGTPLKPRLAAMPASTSTPLADRNTNHGINDSTVAIQNAEDMSPICMPPNKSRRLGLSLSRNRY